MPLMLTPETERAVTAWIDRGDYQSPDAVVSAAIAALDEKKRESDSLSELRCAIEEGYADVLAGRVGPFDPMATLARIRADRASKVTG